MIAPDGRTCPHEECMTACPVCADVWAEMPEACEHNDCGEHPRRELVNCPDDDHATPRMLCVSHARAARKALMADGDGDDAYDRMKDDAMWAVRS